MITVQPPPLLTNYLYGFCAHRFGYIFWRWFNIAINTKAYQPNPGDIFSIPMVKKSGIYSMGFGG